jgi:hypothetical protein
MPPSLVKGLQPGHDAVKRGEPSVEPLIQMIIRSRRATRGIRLQFSKEIRAIRACFHRDREDPLHQEIVERLQGDFIGFRERFVQLLRRISLGILERLAVFLGYSTGWVSRHIVHGLSQCFPSGQTGRRRMPWNRGDLKQAFARWERGTK